MIFEEVATQILGKLGPGVMMKATVFTPLVRLNDQAISDSGVYKVIRLSGSVGCIREISL